MSKDSSGNKPRTGRTVGAIFNCTCGKSWEDYATAQIKAKRHAEYMGHVVTGEVTKFFIYGKQEAK